MKNLHKFLHLSWAEQWLIIHATWWLSVITLGVSVMPLPTIQRLFLNSPTPRTRTQPAQRIAEAVRAASRLVPGATCLPQAITAQYLLMRNGYPAELQIGAARSADGTLEAHAWVVSEGAVVIGGLSGLDRFVSLSSPQRSPTQREE